MEFTLLVEWSYGSSIYKERKDNRSHLAQNHLTVALYSLKTCFLFLFLSPFIPFYINRELRARQLRSGKKRSPQVLFRLIANS